MDTIKIIDKDGTLKAKKIGDVIIENENLIINICRKWIFLYSFDRSITRKDLEQDLKEHFYKNLKNYDYKKCPSVKPYMKRIAINFLIRKRVKFLKKLQWSSLDQQIHNNKYPMDSEGFESNLIDFIKSEELTTEDLLIYKEMLERLKTKISHINYKPRNFIKKQKNFVSIILSILLSENEEFKTFFAFRRRCYKRALKNNRHLMKTGPIYAEIIASFLNVNGRAVNLGIQLIKKTLKDITEGEF